MKLICNNPNAPPNVGAQHGYDNVHNEMMVNNKPLAYFALKYGYLESLTPNYLFLKLSSGAKPYEKIINDSKYFSQ